MQNIIKYSGLKDLDAEEQSILKNLIEKEYPRIQRLVKNVSDLIVNVKVSKKQTRKRYIISFRLEAPTRMFSVKTKDTEMGGDWDITKATHKALNALYFEVKHRLKSDTGSWKKGGIKALFKRFQL